MAYLIKTSGKSSRKLFETSNFIPAFWFGLFDFSSVETIKNELINSVYKVNEDTEGEEYYTIKLSKNKFMTNLESRKIFFENYYADKVNLYNDFTRYLDNTFSKNDILELNILEGVVIDAEYFIEEILNTINNIWSNINELYRFEPKDNVCYSFVGCSENEFDSSSKEYSEYFNGQNEIVHSLYKMIQNDIIWDDLTCDILFGSESIKVESTEDFYKWSISFYFEKYLQSKGLNVDNLYLTSASMKEFNTLRQSYDKAVKLMERTFEKGHYDSVMSHIDECIEWGGCERKKFTRAEINKFFIDKKINTRWKEKLKHIFYLKTNEKLKKEMENIKIGKHDEKEEDQYVMPYLNSIEPFSSPLDYTKYEFKKKIYAKKWLILAVITEHLRLHPQASLKNLRDDFSITNSWGFPVEIIYDYNYVRERSLELHCLFGDVLLLSNGEKGVISDCSTIEIINAFINKAKKFGYEIKTIEQY